MNIQDKTKKELISELKELQEENNSLRTLCDEISSLKKKEMDLIAYEIRYRSLFELAKNGILILDAETGKIVDVNPFLIDLLGYDYDQFIEKSIWEIGIFRDIIDNQDKFIELRKNKYVRYNNLPLETKDGRIIYVEFVSNVHLEDNQNVIQCNIRDISARKIIEKELIRAKEQVEENGKHSTELGIVKKELDYQVEEKEKLHEELIIANKELVFQNKEKEKRANELENANKELVYQNKEKEKRTNELEIANKELAIQSDLKEKRAAELSIANQELQNFTYVASHDLQEPLRMISSFLELIKSRYAEKLDESGIEFINFAVDGSIRMKQLINDLLLFSRVGTSENPFEKTDLNDILNLVKRDLSIAIADASFTIHADNLPELVADKSIMKQLFQNLISNAIKFKSNENPKIEIKVKKEKKNWIFSFADNGIGINKQHFDRIFVIFQRLHTRDEYPGTGIGLAICKKIVERHQGKIWLESVMGSGTTFYFKLPIKIK